MKCQTIGTYKEAALFVDILCRVAMVIVLMAFAFGLIWYALLEKLNNYRHKGGGGSSPFRPNPYDRPDDDESETVH